MLAGKIHGDSLLGKQPVLHSRKTVSLLPGSHMISPWKFGLLAGHDRIALIPGKEDVVSLSGIFPHFPVLLLHGRGSVQLSPGHSPSRFLNLLHTGPHNGKCLFILL